MDRSHLIPLLLCFGPPAMAQEPPGQAPPGESTVAEIESATETNADPKGRLVDLRPGQTLRGAFQRQGDVDLFRLVLDRPAVLNLRWKQTAHPARYLTGRLAVGLGKWVPKIPLGAAPVEVLRHRFPAGAHLVRLSAYKTRTIVPYELRFEPTTLAPDAEAERNEHRNTATPLALGLPRHGWTSHPGPDIDWYSFKVDAVGVYELTLATTPKARAGRKSPPTYRLKVFRGAKLIYTYRLDLDHNPHFYPVLDPGQHHIRLSSLRAETGDAYRLSLRAFTPTVDPALVKLARAAIDRGVGWLIDASPAAQPHPAVEVVALATQLAALAEGSGAKARTKERQRCVRGLIARLSKLLRPVKGARWQGKQVQAFGRASMYEQAIATLALAEAVAAGYAEARQPCLESVRYLLAAQLSPQRQASWGAVPKGHKSHGGWRYGPSARDADLSVTGWCVVGLYAADVAKVSLPGLVPAVRRAIAYVKRCTTPRGFSYQAKRGGQTSIRHGIGALIYLLFEQQGKELQQATAHLDRHLCAGTQTGEGHDSPFYYWYYGTRVDYLRGGVPWQAWRATALRQLIRRQTSDGSWDPLRDERKAGRRYSTAFAVMILRLCLNEAPAYLDRELEAF